MKKLPIILMLFCTALPWSLGTQATEGDWRDQEVHFQPRRSNFERQPSCNDFFDEYEGTMESLDSADKKADQDINTYYAPLDLVHPPTLEEDHSIMERTFAESLKTAEIENTQREFDVVKERSIHLNNKIGELTRIVDERWEESQSALRLYLDLSKSDPEIEALEIGDEKTRRLKERQEIKDKATQNWLRLHDLHTAAKKDLQELEEKGNVVDSHYLALSQKLESLKEPK